VFDALTPKYTGMLQESLNLFAEPYNLKIQLALSRATEDSVESKSVEASRTRENLRPIFRSAIVSRGVIFSRAKENNQTSLTAVHEWKGEL